MISLIVEPRSYRIEIEDGEYKRNRKHLLKTGDPTLTAETDVDHKGAEPCHLAMLIGPNLKSAGEPNQA